MNKTFTYNLEDTTKAYLTNLIPEDTPDTDTDYHREVRIQSLRKDSTPVSDLLTLTELVTIIKLPTKKASAEDKISNFMIKQACTVVGSSLLAVLTGVFMKVSSQKYGEKATLN